jgi:hypothetical protein
MPTLFEVRLQEIHVEENGYWEDEVNSLGFTLLYPREGVPAVATTRTARLPDKERLDFAATMLQAGRP